MEDSRRATIYFEAQLHQALRLKAAAANRSISDMVNEAVRLSLAEDAEDLSAAHGSEEERWAWLARRLVQEELLDESDDGAQRLWLRASGRHYQRRPWPLRWSA